MLISFREAADLSLQMTLAFAVVVGGMSLATAVARSSERPRQTIDVNRPILWASGPIRIDRQAQVLTITVRPAAKSGADQANNTVCSDAIGLRIACDLLGPNHRPS